MELSETIKEKFYMTPSPDIIIPSKLINHIQSLLPLVQSFLEDRPRNTFYRDEEPSSVNQIFNKDLPIEPDSLEDIFKFLRTEIITRFPSISNPHFLAFIPSDPAPPALLGALLTPLFNQFTGTVIGSPGGSAIEGLAIKWIKDLLGFDSSSWGSFTMGGSDANLTCMYAGLVDKVPWNIKKEGLCCNKRLIIYTSDQSHNCVIKAGMLLGLGKESIKVIQSDNSYRLTPKACKSAIEEDEKQSFKYPIMIVASAGTTNTGAIDDISGLFKLAQEKNLWFHIDGAYGAFAKISDTQAAQQLESLNLADSIALDAHKWLFTPFEAGCAIVRQGFKLKRAFDLGAEYLKDTDMSDDILLQRNFRSYGFPLSRELRGLKIWMIIRNYGKIGLKNLITRNILVADYLRQKIIENPHLELMTTGLLSVVCFRWIGSDEFNERIISFLQRRKKFYISRTTIKNRVTLRVCILNLHTTPEIMDKLIEEIEEIADELSSE